MHLAKKYSIFNGRGRFHENVRTQYHECKKLRDVRVSWQLNTGGTGATSAQLLSLRWLEHGGNQNVVDAHPTLFSVLSTTQLIATRAHGFKRQNDQMARASCIDRSQPQQHVVAGRLSVQILHDQKPSHIAAHCRDLRLHTVVVVTVCVSHGEGATATLPRYHATVPPCHRPTTPPSHRATTLPRHRATAPPQLSRRQLHSQRTTIDVWAD